MNCRKASRFLALYVGDELGPRKERAVRAHLESCPRCRAEAEDYRVALERARMMTAAEAAPDWTDAEWRKMMASIVSTPVEKRPFRAFALKPALAAGAFCLVVLGTQAVIRHLLRTSEISTFPARQDEPLGRLFSALPAFDSASLAAVEKVAGLQDPAFPVLAFAKQDVPALTMITPESGLKIVWFFNENLELEE
ncbi:MAG: hypothetical protein FJY82_03940 [Candidatus Aminicenantes bacterium]|nr:hypothetical protein [Candidatus Aminicenantes bacterium]